MVPFYPESHAKSKKIAGIERRSGPLRGSVRRKEYNAVLANDPGGEPFLIPPRLSWGQIPH